LQFPCQPKDKPFLGHAILVGQLWRILHNTARLVRAPQAGEPWANVHSGMVHSRNCHRVPAINPRVQAACREAGGGDRGASKNCVGKGAQSLRNVAATLFRTALPDRVEPDGAAPAEER